MSRAPTLSVVADNDLRTPDDTPRPETTSDRARRLQAEIKALASDQRAELVASMRQVIAHTGETAANEAQPPGVRDLCRRFVEDCEARVQTLQAISARS